MFQPIKPCVGHGIVDFISGCESELACHSSVPVLAGSS